MQVTDFSYGEHYLHDFGMILCSFGGSKGLETIDNGSEVTFNTVSTQSGSKFVKTSSEYENVLTTTVQICKNPCFGDDMEISSETFRELTKWLCRENFLKMKFMGEYYIDLYYEAKIKVSRIEIDSRLVGLELEIETNRPFALKEPKIVTIKNTTQNGIHSINDTSHKEGHIYPYTEITIESDGDLNIYNAIEDRNTIIKNCVTGEVITMDYPIITSSLPSHNIQNDFNYTFFRVANTYENSRNDLTISIPCTIKMKYSPIVKVGL